jgi:hypothetical protein
MALYLQLSTQNVFTKYLSVSSITGGNSINTQQLNSTVASLANTSVIPSVLSTQSILASSITASTVTAPVMSTLVLYVSSIIGVTTGGGGGITTIPDTLSTFSMYTSSLQASTVIGRILSSQQLFTSSIFANSLTAPTISAITTTSGTFIGNNLFVSSGVVSSISTNAITFSGGFGYLTMPDIYPNSVYTSTVTTSNILVGTNSVISPIQFFGYGTYSNTVISELSTGGTTQELLLFRGSNASDRIRMQTTGSVVFEPGVSARIWPTAPSNITPAMIINASSNVGIQTATPGAALDVAGISRAVILSSQQLFTSSIQTNNLLINGTGVARFMGSRSGNLYGSNIDTFTLQASTSAYSTGIASLAFATNTPSYPLARIYAEDSAFSGSSISQLIFQTVPTPASTFSTVYTYAGVNQSFTVPTGVSLLQVSVWGAGGCGGNGGPGGAGAFVQGLLSVTPGQQLNLVVGQGGVFNSTVPTFGGGGAGSNLGYTGSGGGRSAIQMSLTATIRSSSGTGTLVTYTTSINHGLQQGEPVVITGLSPAGFNGTYAVASVVSPTQFRVISTQSGSSTGTGTITAEVVTIGAGGSGPQNGLGSNGGAATFSGTAFSAPAVWGGGGGSQIAGGAAGTSGSLPAGLAGSILTGGTGSLAGGGGGAGYYGGGGGGWTSGVANGGGGGGSSYISNNSFTFLIGSNSPNSSNQAPASTSPFYQSGVAAGGAANTNGGAGLIVLASIGGFLTEAMRIDVNGNVGIQNSLPTTALDVGGTGRFQNLSTLNINISTINGQLFGGPINSSIIGLGQIYPSTASMMSSINRSISSFSTALGAVGGSTTNPASLTVSSLFTSSIFNHGTISTHSLVIYGPSTLTVQGLSYFQNVVSTQTLITTSLGIIDSATGNTSYIETSNGSLIVNNLSTSELTISSLNIIDGNTGIINSLYVSSGLLKFNTSTLNGNASQTTTVSSGVIQIVAGTNVTISPVDGVGIVTINASGGGGGGPSEPVPYLSSYSLSTGYIFSPLQLGTLSTVTAFEFNGLFGNYNNTVLAEISTGGGSQELLIFKGSSASDRVRVQTTGDVVFETGVSARLWSDTTVPTLPNTTPAMIINSSSNVGIQTATPGTALDVAGTGRFITASSISLYTGAFYTGVYFL